MSKWEKVRLGDVCTQDIETIKSGDDFLIDYVDISSVDNERKRIVSYRTMNSRKAPSRARQILTEGDILVSTVRPNLNAVAINQIESENVVVGSTGYCVLRCSERIERNYAFHFCRSEVFISGLVMVARGASYPAVTDSDVRNTRIPLPPLETQRQIAQTLDTAAELLAMRKQQLTELERLITATFHEMFGDLVTNDRGWTVDTLEGVCERITDGTHQTPEYAEQGYVFLSSRNVTSGSIDWHDVKYIPEHLHTELYRRLAPQKNDILLAKNGTTGIAAIVDRDCVFDIYVSLALLRPGPHVHPVYLLHAINSDASKYQFNRSLKGIGVPNLHLSSIRTVKILLPPIENQTRFAEIVAKIEEQKALVKKAIDETQHLFDSLMSEFFE